MFLVLHVTYFIHKYLCFLLLSIQVGVQKAGDVQFVFEAKRGQSVEGDIAVDDIRFFKGPCTNIAFCDFEGDERCGYENDPNSDIPWIYSTANVPSGELDLSPLSN